MTKCKEKSLRRALESSLRISFGDEEIDYTHNPCLCKKAIDTTSIAKLPENLLICMLRFQGILKSDKACTIPDYIDVGDSSCKPTCTLTFLMLTSFFFSSATSSKLSTIFRLKTAVCHTGEKDSGHYFAYSRKE